MGTNLLEKTCPNCKNVFHTFRSINSICCCRQCSREFFKKKHYNEKARKCAVCDKLFVPKHSRSKGIYCSYKCRGVVNRKEKINRGGYVYIHAPAHPFATKQGLVAEHRIIIEREIGRYLRRPERVHHINHKPDDNRLENLLLCKGESEHKITHNGLKYGVSKKGNPKEWWKRVNKTLGDRHAGG